MAVDTRPSVTVIGTIATHLFAAGWLIDLDDLPDIGLQDGDEVEVTIRRHERATGNLFPAPDEADE